MKIHIRMKRLKIMALLILTQLIMIHPQEEVNLNYGDWDKDANGLISRSEFIEVFSEHYYQDWNIRDDEYFDDEDFYHTSFSMWDTDEDSLLSEDEWGKGIEYFYKENAAKDFIGADINKDGTIDHDEFVDVLDDTDFFEAWDVDANEHLNELEIARGVFNNWDRDHSNFLDPQEYENFDSYYLDT